MEVFEDRFLKPWVVALFFAVLLAAVLSPFLFGDKLVTGSQDAEISYYPLFYFYGNAVKNGDSFLWNPHIFSGFPSYLSQVAGFLEPLNFTLFKLFRWDIAFHLRLFIDFFLTAVFSYAAGRAFGISRLASALIGISYLTAFKWFFLFNPIIANTLFLLPMLIFFSARALASKTRWWRWGIGGGIGVGWAFLGGYAQVTIYALLLSALFLAFWFFICEKDRTARRGFQYAAFIVIIAAVGFVIALPMILPSLEHAAFTFRSEGVSYDAATLKAVAPNDFVYFLFPDFVRFPLLTQGKKVLYVGALWFLLALVGIAALRRRRFMFPIAALFGFSLLASLKWSPVFYLMHQFPIFDYFRYPQRWMYLGAWFLAFLGAYGFDAAKEYAGSRLMKRVSFGAGIVAGMFVFLVSSLNIFGNGFWSPIAKFLARLFQTTLYGSFGFTKAPEHYTEAFGRLIAEWQSSFALTEERVLVAVGALIAGIIILALYAWQRIDWEYFRIGAAAISIATFLGIFVVQWDQAISRSDVVSLHKELIAKVIPSEEAIRYRIVPFITGFGPPRIIPASVLASAEGAKEAMKLHVAGGAPNLNLYGVTFSTDGYDPFITRALFWVLVRTGSPYGGESSYSSVPGTDQLSVEEIITRFLQNLDLTGMMAGKYIVTGISLENQNLKLLGKYPITSYQIPLYVYENNNALPRWYFAKNVTFVPHSSPIELIEKGLRDFSETTYIDCEPCGAPQKGKTAPELRLVRLKNGFFEFAVEPDVPRWLIVSESFLPGWVATIDGKPAVIRRANGLYMAIEVPASRHTIAFSYEGMFGEAKILRALRIMK